MAESKKSKKSDIQKKLDRYGLKKVNTPVRDESGGKKFKVLAKKGDKTKLIRFGDADMTIKKDQKDRKKSYCARSSGIKGTDDKFSANYWSRKKWNC